MHALAGCGAATLAALWAEAGGSMEAVDAVGATPAQVRSSHKPWI